VPEEAALSRSRLMRMIEDGAVLRGDQPLTSPRTRVEGRHPDPDQAAQGVETDTLAQDIALSVVMKMTI
jgi:23S rRNA pseudouridine1911/1915/1917 synthase